MKRIFLSTMLVAGVVGLGLSVPVFALSGIAAVAGTAPDSKISGTVTFTDTADGLKVLAKLAHVPEGPHGFHIHEFGACGDLGKAAGGHYNPAHAAHGMVTQDGVQHSHAGDLGNITAAKDGTAVLEAVIPGVTLSDSKFTVGGRAVILHEKADDFGQPVGNAGGRIGCGLIHVTAN